MIPLTNIATGAEPAETAKLTRAEMEESLVQIWQEVFSCPVKTTDNFLALGGNSLRALRVITRMEARHGIVLPLRILLTMPTLADVAAEIDSAKHLSMPKVALERAEQTVHDGELLPVSAAQSRFWLLQQMQPENLAYHIPATFRLEGALNPAVLAESFRRLIARHPILRTTYVMQEGELRQKIGAQWEPVLPVTNLCSMPAANREAGARRRAMIEMERPFDLEHGPVIHTHLFQLSDTEYFLTLVLHHIAGDGWSMSILYREISQLYQALIQNETPSLPKVPLDYANFALRQRKPDSADDITYWEKQLSDPTPGLNLPIDFPSGKTSAIEDVKPLIVARDVTKALHQLGRQEGVTVFMTLLAAWQTVLFRQTGQTDFLIGVPATGRNQLELENVFGCFLNTLPMRANLSGQLSFRQLLRDVRETALSAYEHQQLPVEKQLGKKAETNARDTPPFQVLFNHLNFERSRLGLTDVSVQMIHLPQLGVNADLELYARERDDRIVLQLVGRPGLFRAETIRQLLEQLQTVLAGAVKDPELSIAKLPLFTPEQQVQQRSEYRRRLPARSFAEFPPEEIEQSIPARFEKQVRQHPNQLAIKSRNHQWTYSQLNQQANRIAHTLATGQHQGASRVALWLDHDAPMLAAILAVLKAGMVYVPLPVNHPPARLTKILADCAPHFLLTDHAFTGVAKKSIPENCTLLDIDTISGNTAASDLELNIFPDAPAYILYTSGSTGVPKGVLQNHRNVLHFARVYTNALHLGAEDRLTLFSSCAHDAGVMDIFGALLNGATLYPHDVQDESPADLVEALKTENVTVFHSTPTVFRHIIGTLKDGECLPFIRLVVLGGEAAVRYDAELHRRHFSSDCILVNGLGPTEATIALQYFSRHDSPLNSSTIPVGHPVENTYISLLDEAGCETDLCGEIVIHSRHVALGYWHRPEETAQKFRSDPARAGWRIYRTGDLARRRPDGMLEFLGRKDQQVKIRGLRVELGEIEAILRLHPGVRDAVVVHRVEGDSYLTAYIVRQSDTTVPAEHLRSHLQSRLPESMVPSVFTFLGTLPLTVNGKIDRNALPCPVPSIPSSTAIDRSPQNILELELIRIWQQLFKRQNLGRQDNFFHLGGHSLLAVRLAVEIEKMTGEKFNLSRLFQTPTIAALALQLSEQDPKRHWNSLVPLQPHGSKAPVYFVHGSGGDVFGFYPLTQRLGPDQPAYGFQAVGLNGSEPRHTTVEQMAAHYIKEMRAFQPVGPYHLAGYSTGGLLAYEMARQLEQQGETTGLLALLDTFPLPVPTLSYAYALTWHFARRTSYHLARWRQTTVGEQWNYFADLSRSVRYWLVRNQTNVEPSHDYDYYVAVARSYQLRPYPGQADLFIADSINLQLMNHWNRLARGGVKRHRVSGSHTEMFAANHLESFAQTFAKALQSAQAKKLLPKPIND